MELLSITVAGFRNLRSTKVALDESIVALVSTNNYGKSNFLDAVAFGIRFMDAAPQTRRRMMGDTGCMPLVRELATCDYTFEMELRVPELGSYQYIRYAFSLAWRRDDGTGERITQEKIELSSRRGGTWASYLKRDSGKCRPGRTARRCARKLDLDDDQLAIDVLGAIGGSDIRSVIRAIHALRYEACHPLGTDGAMVARPLGSAGQEGGVFALSEHDLPRSLFELKRRHPDRYAEFQDVACGLFPEIGDIGVVSSGPQDEQTRHVHDAATRGANELVPYRIRNEVHRVYVTTRHLNQPVSLTRMSDGVRRVILLVARAVAANIAGISCLGVEEVESGIHPRTTQGLLEAIRAVLGTTKVIVTSHAPRLIRCLPINSLYVGVPNDKGVASFAAIKAERAGALADAAYGHGMTAGEYVFALMSQGRDEEDALRDYLEVG